VSVITDSSESTFSTYNDSPSRTDLISQNRLPMFASRKKSRRKNLLYTCFQI